MSETNAEPPDPGDTVETDGGETDADLEDLPPVKERESKMVYLPKSMEDNEFGLAVTQIQLTWQQAGKEKDLKKLRHIYPLLIKVGIEGAQDLTADEIKEYVDQFEEDDREHL